MDIICEHCNAKLSIADNKIPKGKRFSFSCPRCKGKIHIIKQDTDPVNSGNKYGPDANAVNMSSEIISNNGGECADYDAADKPFDFLDEDVRTVLICTQKDELRKIFEKIFDKMKYQFISVNQAATALTRMKYHIFDSIMLHDEFDINNRGAAAVLKYMQSLNMDIRRRIFVVLVSKKYHTADNMAAFHKSVNLIINEKDFNHLETIFLRNVREYKNFYSVFNDSFKKAGKI